MKSRLIQQVAKLVMMACMYLAGRLGLSISEGGQAELMQTVLELVTAGAAVVAWFLDQWIHKRETGGVMKPAGSGAGEKV